ncbi:arrestin [Colletotrichum graminicola M1.001]|uniref:Arrestin n=1 Tax=Colletotrichum graminicola (strain M1.001 / M2 / FGSC 10212) TaxID=645133 RepID=E3QUF1_COLGM|nr:arrestin [Colletotrichum graminicola M1.001]EFQ34489.1 arrestin [Colletotrichum graminicola M1.001]
MKRIDRVMLSVAKFIGMSTKDINIVIDHHYMSKVYTCGSTVSGHVEINPRTDIPFSLVQISLLEKASIRQEDAYVFTHSTHLFLQLYMPVPESALPTSRLFKVGHSFTIPFQFVIPHNLPEGSCRHRVESSLIRRRHLQLPSTLTGWDKDDLSPETMEVRYCVKAVVSEKATNVAKQPSLKMEAEQFINLLATSPEDLPITINKKDLNFALKNTRHLRKCKRAGSTGYITAKSAQPEADHSKVCEDFGTYLGLSAAKVNVARYRKRWGVTRGFHASYCRLIFKYTLDRACHLTSSMDIQK